MDELDVRICRAIVMNRDLFPYSAPLKISLREVARKLQVDHLTVSKRFKRLREKGIISGWKVFPDPNLFGFRIMQILVNTPPKSPKQDMIEKLKLVGGVVVLLDFVGDFLGVTLLYNSDQSLSQAIELISRITNAVNVTQVHLTHPSSKTNHLTDTDWAIIHSLQSDGLKSHVQVAKELGLTPKTVKNRLKRLELEHTLTIVPTFDTTSIDGMIGLVLYYSYTNQEVKSTVDKAMLAHFEGSYLWAALSDPERAYLNMVATSMSSVKRFLEWAKEQPGVATADILLVLEGTHLWRKAGELLHQQISPPTLESPVRYGKQNVKEL